jgi:NAD(P) transhydrogenase subunit alpha
MIQGADIIVQVRKPSPRDVELMREGAVCIGLLDPFQSPELIKALAQRGVSAISLEMVPRSTRAQKMDVLSSQASLAGYAAVIVAAGQSGKIFPMMMTPAGTIKPVKVFIIGAGVAGLQAIATAKRLGAKVEAFDTRPVVEEQVRSLGAKFVKIDVGETGQTEGGYAKALTDEQIKLQREGMTRVCAESDIVITAAQVFGRRAPILLTSEMLDAMKPGSVVVDLAVESGGNVEGVVADQITRPQRREDRRHRQPARDCAGSCEPDVFLERHRAARGVLGQGNEVAQAEPRRRHPEKLPRDARLAGS